MIKNGSGRSFSGGGRNMAAQDSGNGSVAPSTNPSSLTLQSPITSPMAGGDTFAPNGPVITSPMANPNSLTLNTPITSPMAPPPLPSSGLANPQSIVDSAYGAPSRQGGTQYDSLIAASGGPGAPGANGANPALAPPLSPRPIITSPMARGGSLA